MPIRGPRHRTEHNTVVRGGGYDLSLPPEDGREKGGSGVISDVLRHGPWMVESSEEGGSTWKPPLLLTAITTL